MVDRASNLRIDAGARRAWEIQNLMPGTLESVVDRALALDPGQVYVRRVLPIRTMRSLHCVLDGWQVRILGEVDAAGRWYRIREVHAQASE